MVRRWWLGLSAIAIAAACHDYAADSEAPADAGADAGEDANVTSDAASDGPPAPPFCAQHPDASFCDDFDDDQSLPRNWTAPTVLGGTLGIVPEQTAPSLPNVLHPSSLAPNPAEGDHAHVWMMKHFDVTPVEVQVSFSLRLDEADGGLFGDSGLDNSRYAQINLLAPSDVFYIIGFDITKTGRAQLREFMRPAAGQPAMESFGTRDVDAPAQGKWARIQLGFANTTDAGKGNISLSIDGAIVLARPLTYGNAALTSGKLEVGVGLVNIWVLPGGAKIDDVLITYR